MRGARFLAEYNGRRSGVPNFRQGRAEAEGQLTSVEELIVAPVREHSRKPAETRDRIARLVCGPYLELFAGSRAEGWKAWGTEVGKFGDEPAEADGAKEGERAR